MPGGTGTRARGSLGGWMSGPVPWCWCQACAWAGQGARGVFFPRHSTPRMFPSCLLRPGLLAMLPRRWAGSGCVPALPCQTPAPSSHTAPAGALAEARCLQRGFVLHASFCSRELGVCLGTAAWEGAHGHGAVFASAPHARGALRTDVHALLPGISALHPLWGPAAAHPPPSPTPGCEAPAGSIPLPSGTASPLSPCPSCPRGCCPCDSGCRTPSRSPTKTLLSGTERGSAGLGGPGWDASPRIPIRRGGLQGLCEARPPPPPAAAGGSGRGKRGPAAAPGNKESVWLVTALRKRGETNAPLIGGEVTAQETLPGGRPGGCGCSRAFPQRFPPLPRSSLSCLPLGSPSSHRCVGHLPRAPSALLWVHGLDLTFLSY